LDIDPLSAFVAFLALIATIVFGHQQIVHNRNSVMPWPEFTETNDDEKGEIGRRITVEIENRGTGPLIIRSVLCDSPEGTSVNLVDLLPTEIVRKRLKLREVPMPGNAIVQGGTLTLLDIRPETRAEASEIKQALAGTTITLKYTDIYNKLRKTKIETLDFFGGFA